MESNKLVIAIVFVGLLSSSCQAAAKNDFLRHFFAGEYEQSIWEKSENVNEEAAQDTKKGPVDLDKVVTDSVGQEKVAITPEDAKYKLSYENYDLTWRYFKKEHNRSYESATEEKRRFAIFMDNVKMIERHNWQFHNGLTTYWMDINQFSDWTNEEFAAMTPIVDPSVVAKWEAPNNGTHQLLNDLGVPSYWDWRSKGYVTAVKYQGSCGSCWAFSATGSLEGQWFAKTGRLVSLSEQQLMDCSTAYGNHGCKGGLPDRAFAYIRDEGGLEAEQSYPYKATPGACRYNRQLAVAKVQSFRDIATGSEIALKGAVANVGPIAVAVYVTENFRNYQGGVFVDQTCVPGQINHGVLVVGYGSTGSTDYWIVKNSWGPSWGQKGYIFMARNRANMCSIATLASYPVV